MNKKNTSYGVIAYNKNNGVYRFLLVQRRYSFSYTAIMRGHYHLSDTSYIESLVKRLTPLERNKLLTLNFERLWRNLWLFSNNNPLFKPEYLRAKKKFKLLASNFVTIFKKNPIEWTEPEWGIPKGKKRWNESGEETASREFLEETNVPVEQIRFVPEEELHPMCEEYIGDNRIHYIHYYYLAYCNKTIGFVDPTNLTQACEIGKVAWFTIEEIMKICRPYHTARKNIFLTLSNYLCRNNI